MQFFIRTIVFLVFLSSIVEAKQLSYKWYKTYEVRPSNQEQRSALSELKEVDGIDFWTMPSKLKPAIVMVAPRRRQQFLQVLTQLEIPYEIVISDMDEVLSNESQHQKRQKGHRRGIFNDHLTRFLRYDEIIQFLRNMVQENSEIARLSTIGKSFEGRPVYMIKISKNFKAKKPIVMLEAGMHAREWIAPAFTLHIIDQLLKYPSFLSQNDYYIIPVVNPDGYEYTHTTDRLWRKTRSERPGDECIGVDGNRNFDTNWAVVGSSNVSCTDIYHGPSAFSEVECRNLRDIASKYASRIKLYVSTHSFGNYILYPMGHTTDLLPDFQKLDSCAALAAESIKKMGGPDFMVGNTATVLYPSGGGADDFMKEKLEIPYAYTMELPGGGETGFDMPPENIEETVKQIFPGILALANCWCHDQVI